ncbi:cation:proton antiporter [Faecalicoccus pleomorphus]|uniref:Cation:proton antiporter n=1 Tax=Faecalicoccus pleomorphus TaxID=1323 RepID=A0A3E3E844_9FIRM|nr:MULTISPECIES: cation:proton antiporter [Faecalicoccus]MBE6120310.1 cation:proton antiporter [Erysipelotrichaceae bacterium]MCI6380455.1 cation:proton antiporter [Erysipelotrichaceae bacterium]MDB7988455.1 cation:proton antiporter [Faecalicoccus pleomorphus]MDB7992650.1 cation:proton antiporter [Faecalicoccus pleomorphus]MDY4279251.1 cation:proton antiporter [Faecalicoccus sp.]
MSDYRYLLDIALILLGTKAFGLFTRKLRMPAVVGALLAGIILGPAVLNWVQPSNLISSLSEIGVIVLMFGAGLETSITDLKKAGLKALVIAVLGVLVPLGLGYWIATFYNVGPEAWIGNLFLGVILTATSVGITVETLKEMGAMKTTSGNAILAAAVIDDVLGIIALTIVSGLADSSVNVGIVLLKIVLFFIFAVIVGVLLHKVFAWWFDHDSRGGLQRYSIISFAFALIMAFVSEEFFGVADITGSFVAGLIISGTSQCAYVTKRIGTLSYLLISPVFFASIGLKLEPFNFSGSVLLLILLLCVIALLSKVVGCGLGALLCHYSKSQAIRIGCGMVSRGEVALIVANKGMALGIFPNFFVTPVLLCVVFTTIITPILLKVVYKKKPNDPDYLVTSSN